MNNRKIPGWWPYVLLVLAAVAAFHNSFAAPFTFDDIISIRDNPTLLDLWPLTSVLKPIPGAITVSGRPILNLSFALNRALLGPGVWGFHLVNLGIHLMSGLLLFGVVRRTLVRHKDALLLALAIAMLWLVHPLQTESVTYTVQRAESLMGLLLLLTLYATVRGAESSHPWRWYPFAIVSCALGMGVKEVMVVAPILTLLYDRAFIGGSFAAAWRQRKGLYLGLAATWIPLAWLVVMTGTRDGTTGLGLGISPLGYALIQCQALVRYLALCFWPHPLVFDYGLMEAHGVRDVLPYAVLLAPLLGLTAYGLYRNRPIAFLGAWFFLILAPTSSILPSTRQTMAEHRMYLPLAAVLVVAVLGLHVLLQRRPWRTGVVAALWVVALCLISINRNEDYRSEFFLYAKTVAAMPDNAHAQHNYGVMLSRAGQVREGLQHIDRAIELLPNERNFYLNRAAALLALQRRKEALEAYETAFRLGSVEPQYLATYAATLLQEGRVAEAALRFDTYLRVKPDDSAARHLFAEALFKAGRPREALTQLEALLRVDPGDRAAQEYRRLILEPPAD